MLDFVCVGDATRDLFLFPEGLEIKDYKLELEYGAKIPVSDIAWSLGGNAANVAVGLSKLGINTSLATIFGDDERGVWIKRELLKNNVNLDCSKTDPKRQSNLSTIIVINGERTILSYHCPTGEKIDSLPQASWFYLTSYAHVDWEKIPAKLAFNPNMMDLKEGKTEPIVDRTEVLILNKEEAAVLGRLGPKITVVTDGPNGATVYANGQTIQKPSVGGKAVEATGAGDAFSSGFLAALFYGNNIETALDWGLRNSGSVIQKIGAIEGLLTYEGISH